MLYEMQEFTVTGKSSLPVGAWQRCYEATGKAGFGTFWDVIVLLHGGLPWRLRSPAPRASRLRTPPFWSRWNYRRPPGWSPSALRFQTGSVITQLPVAM